MNFLRRRSIEIGFIAALLVVYIFLSAPGLTWGDGVFIALAVERPTRPAEYFDGHPVYCAAARAFVSVVPVGDTARRLNLFSSVAATGAVALFLTVLFQLGLGRGAAISGAALLAFSHLFWFHAEVTEVYALFACSFFGTIALLLRYLSARSERNLLLLLCFLGLACGCHPLIILAYPGIAAAIWRNRPDGRLGAKGVIRCVFAFIIGLAPIIHVFIIGAVAVGVEQGLLNAFFLGRSSLAAEVFGLEFITKPYLLGRNLLLFVAVWFYQFAGFAVVLVSAGILRLWRKHRDLALFALITAVLNFAFAIDYNVSDQLVFYAPIFLLSSLSGALGAEWLLQRFRRRLAAASALAALLVVFPAVSYQFAPGVYRGLGKSLVSFHEKPYRDPVRYFLVPAKRNFRQIEQYIDEVFKELPENAIVFLDSPDYLFFQYSQHEHKTRKDVKVQHLYIAGRLQGEEIEGLARTLLSGPSYVGPVYAKLLSPYFEFEKIGLTSRVTGRLKER